MDDYLRDALAQAIEDRQAERLERLLAQIKTKQVASGIRNGNLLGYLGAPVQTKTYPAKPKPPAPPKLIAFTSSHALSEADFEGVKGTDLFVEMRRNHCVIDNGWTRFDDMRKWLCDNCNSFFYIVRDGPRIKSYIESTSDALAFRMVFEGAEE